MNPKMPAEVSIRHCALSWRDYRETGGKAMKCILQIAGLSTLLLVGGGQNMVNPAYASETRTCDRILQPRQIQSDIRVLSIGPYHSLAIKADGSLWVWGINAYGGLGDGTTVDSFVPKRIGNGYVSAVAGAWYSLAVKDDGTLWSWGQNSNGQLGDGTTVDRPTPLQIGSGFRSVAAGWNHSLGLKSDGSLWAWGDNFRGTLGDGSTTDRMIPKQIGEGFVAVFASRTNSTALHRDGSLWTWGSDGYGRLDSTKTVVPKQIGTGFVVAAAHAHGLALKSDGSLWTWGPGGPLLGDRTKTDRSRPEQIDIQFIWDPTKGGNIVRVGNQIAAIAVGDGHSLALTKDGRVLGWGYNFCGQLGDTGLSDHERPVIVSGLNEVVSVFAAAETSFAVKKDGTVWLWGRNIIPQLKVIMDGVRETDSQKPQRDLVGSKYSSTHRA